MSKKISYYRFLIIGLLFVSLIASSINSTKINLLNSTLTVDLGFFKTTVPHLFLILAMFITAIFILNKKLVNKNAITTLLIFYIFYLIAHLVIAFTKGQKITQEITIWVATCPFYPIFALPFLKKDWNFNVNISYLLNKIKWFIYIAILIGVVGLIAKQDFQFLDLLRISLLFLSFELLERKNIRALLPIAALALVSGFNVTWLFTASFLIVLAILYYFKHLNFHKLILVSIVIILVFYAISSFGFLTRINFISKLPPKERFTQAELVRATGRIALWQKYILKYKGDPIEILFGHGTTSIFSLSTPTAVNTVSHLHNIFLDEFYKRGIIGLLLLLSISVVSLKTQAPTYLKIFFILLLIYGQSDLITFYGISGVIFWITVGMLNNAQNIIAERKKISSEN